MLPDYHIHTEGLVQGVGFRPFVYRLAKKFNLQGWVNNSTDGVHLEFTAKEWVLYQKILSRYSETELKHQEDKKLFSSSVGRVFDAVSSLMNLCDKQTYEGEAAMLLQEQAAQYFNQHRWEFRESYLNEIDSRPVPVTTLFKGIIQDIQSRKSPPYIAAKFHYSLVDIIDKIATDRRVNRIAFSGGVFLNSVLVDLLHYHLSTKYKLYFHKELSPNDENISFGRW